ncbi:SDR family oxidoreductase [Lujinxingia vulgaris]|uniref:SDR family oxidoreductase n=1 Tax=Lujinxingia vulgaris TaxID=2600176 RepID=A0A5C6XLA9_9DELT|nr:SDR family NAD(P)-dependent oxidoreductase [Lujinxingia vulgaris]TXD39846.1 SDR family oxidoreductase [Lujinxingia vulgaris]
MKSLSGKVAVITGASRGIGQACAEIFASKGAKVVVSDLPDTGGEEVVEAIERAGGSARFVACDVTDSEQVAALMSAAVDAFGNLDIGVNNAGIGGAQKPTHDYTLEEWQQVLNVNLTGPFLCMKHQLRHMVRARSGAIVNVASILGAVGFAMAPAYVAAKHGLVGLTKTAALEYSHYGVRINAIGPGFVDTPLIQKIKDDESTYEAIVGAHPIGRIARPEEVARMAAFLASDEASFVTGGYYPVDGGYLAR